MCITKKILFLLFICCISFAQQASETWRIGKNKLEYVSKVRVHTITEQAEKINNPVRWQPLASIIPDGTLVKQGDVIATFVSKAYWGWKTVK